MKNINFEQYPTSINIHKFLEKCKNSVNIEPLQLREVETFGYNFSICKELKDKLIRECDAWVENNIDKFHQKNDVSALKLAVLEFDNQIDDFEYDKGFNIDYLWLQSSINYQNISPGLLSGFLLRLQNYESIREQVEQKKDSEPGNGNEEGSAEEGLSVKNRLVYC